MERYPDNVTWKVDIGIRDDSAINFQNEYPGSEFYHIQQQLAARDDEFITYKDIRSYEDVIMPGSDVMKLWNLNVTVRFVGLVFDRSYITRSFYKTFECIFLQNFRAFGNVTAEDGASRRNDEEARLVPRMEVAPGYPQGFV